MVIMEGTICRTAGAVTASQGWADALMVMKAITVKTILPVVILEEATAIRKGCHRMREGREEKVQEVRHMNLAIAMDLPECLVETMEAVTVAEYLTAEEIVKGGRLTVVGEIMEGGHLTVAEETVGEDQMAAAVTVNQAVVVAEAVAAAAADQEVGAGNCLFR